jgi:SMODS-associated NUDIX domain
MKSIFQLVLGGILIILGYKFSDSDFKIEFVAGGIIVLLTLIFTFTLDIIKNRKRLKLILHCFYLKTKKQHIRFSMSYLYRIRIDDKYLLVKNANFGHYQLVGGKYKRLEESQSFLKKEFNATDDIKLPNNGLMKDDFVLFIPAKNAIKFIDWFNTKKDREISHWREFYEELVKTKVLSKKNFPYVYYNYVGTVITPIKKTPGWNCSEILQYDILDLIPTKEQEIKLRELLEKGNTEYYKWADSELIQCLGQDNRQKKIIYKIGEHTKWALNMKWSKD